MRIDSVQALPDNPVPERPPQPQRDELNGFLSAYLADAVKPHRERLVDVVRVISATFAGHSLLNDFSRLASQDQVPVINLVPKGASALTANAEQTTTVWLHKEDLTAGARQIGVTPEVEYAPALLWSLVTARNALSGKAGTDWEELDPVAVQAQFRSEMEAQKEKRSLGSGHDSANEAVRRNSAELAARLTGKTPPSTPDTALPRQLAALENVQAQPADVAGSEPATPTFSQTDQKRRSTLDDPYKPTTEPEAPTEKTASASKMRGAVRWIVKRFQEIRIRIGSGRETPPDPLHRSKSDQQLADKPVDNVIEMSKSKRDSADTRSWTAELYQVTPTAESADEKPVEEKQSEDKQPLIAEAKKPTHRRTKSGVTKPTPPADQGTAFTVGPDPRDRARGGMPEEPSRKPE